MGHVAIESLWTSWQSQRRPNRNSQHNITEVHRRKELCRTNANHPQPQQWPPSPAQAINQINATVPLPRGPRNPTDEKHQDKESKATEQKPTSSDRSNVHFRLRILNLKQNPYNLSSTRPAFKGPSFLSSDWTNLWQLIFLLLQLTGHTRCGLIGSENKEGRKSPHFL